ncbi:MAG: S8 family serine peptidase [Rhodanobacteraceae bacterium]
MLRTLVIAACVVALAACVSMPPQPSPPSAQAADRQLLVMLRTPPPHFRPDRNYAGGYDPSEGRQTRRRLGARLAREHGLILLDAWPMPSLGVDCLVMQADDPAAARERMRELARDPRVDWVQPMHAFHLLAHNDPLYSVQPAARAWHLDELHKRATGRGIVIAEVDSGVDMKHPDLRGQVARSRNFVDDGPMPAERHGTEVAGIIAAVAGNGIGIAGVAPQARLLALRACWQSRSGAACNSFTLAKALQFVLQADPQVLNLSLGGPRDRLLDRLLDLALEQGISVVGAVDPDPASGFPARHPGVLAVANDDAGDDDPVAGELRAPGRGIPATTPGGGWDFVDGSSFAAAQVSGLVALLREISPRADAVQLRAALARVGLDRPIALGLPAKRPMPIDGVRAPRQ